MAHSVTRRGRVSPHIIAHISVQSLVAVRLVGEPAGSVVLPDLRLIDAAGRCNFSSFSSLQQLKQPLMTVIAIHDDTCLMVCVAEKFSLVFAS